MKRSTATGQFVTAPVREAAGAALERLNAGGFVTIDHGGRHTTVPEPVARKIEAVLVAFARGQEPAVVTPDDALTTQQAAALLGLSRPTVIKMMDDGRLPFTKPGAHRRVRHADLLAFQNVLRRQQEAALRDLSALGQAMEAEDRAAGRLDPASL